MTRDEALAKATAMAHEHFMCRGDATPRIKQGYILRETARLLGEPVPRGIDMPKKVRIRLEPEPSLERLLELSIKQQEVKS